MGKAQGYMRQEPSAHCGPLPPLFCVLCVLSVQTKPVDVEELQRSLQTAHAEASERAMSPDIAPDKLEEAQPHRSGP
jgi:hypothetical protein